MPRPIIVDLPYPNVSEVEFDLKSASIISPAYAGLHSELGAVLQYVYHYFNFKKMNDYDTAKVLVGISVAEMQHLKTLGEALSKLGVDPIYTRFPAYKTDYYNTRCVSYSKTAEKMLMDDITGELVAINEYQKMLSLLDNEKVAALISRIILDEELHVKVLKSRLDYITAGS